MYPYVGQVISATTFYAIVDSKDVGEVAIHSVLTGTPTGTWAFARSNSPHTDPVANGLAAAAASTDWVSFAPTGAPANPAGAAQTALFELDPLGARFLLIALTISAGAGTYSLYINGKGRS